MSCTSRGPAIEDSRCASRQQGRDRYAPTARGPGARRRCRDRSPHRGSPRGGRARERNGEVDCHVRLADAAFTARDGDASGPTLPRALDVMRRSPGALARSVEARCAGFTPLATAAAKPAASRRAASGRPRAIRLSDFLPSRPGFRHFAIDRGVDFDLATAHETAPSTRRNKLRREHERVRTELNSRPLQHFSLSLAAESLQIHVTPAP